MPSEGQHIRQARANAELLGVLRQPPSRHPDWAVTVAFYTALHMVEASLSRSGSHHKGHPKRIDAVARHQPAIGDLYIQLYWASRRARYDCLFPSSREAEQDLQDYYEPVKSHMCSVLRVTF